MFQAQCSEDCEERRPGSWKARRKRRVAGVQFRCLGLLGLLCDYRNVRFTPALCPLATLSRLSLHTVSGCLLLLSRYLRDRG